MTDPNRPNLRIYVDWIFPDGEIKYVGAIIRQGGIEGFAYHSAYDGPPIDPCWLNHRRRLSQSLDFRASSQTVPIGDGTLHPVFQDAIPGAFAEQAIRTVNRDFSSFTDLDKLYVMGTQQKGALRFRVDDAPIRDIDVQGYKALERARNVAVEVYLNKVRQLIPKDLLRSFGAGEGGARPKVGFTEFTGEKYIAKFNTDKDPYVSLARIEHLVGVMSQAAGIQTAETRIETLPESNEDVLLSKRFDVIGSGKKTTPLHKMSFARLTGKDNIGRQKAGRADYLDMVAVIRAHSADAEADVRELFKRMVLHAAVNNTDNHLGNFEMMYTESNGSCGWRLAPSYDVTVDDGRSPLSTTMCGFTHKTLSMQFLLRAADKFGIPPNEALEMSGRVLGVVGNFQRYAGDVKICPQDMDILASAIDVQAVQALHAEVTSTLETGLTQQAGRSGPAASTKKSGPARKGSLFGRG